MIQHYMSQLLLTLICLDNDNNKKVHLIKVHELLISYNSLYLAKHNTRNTIPHKCITTNHNFLPQI